MLSQKLNYLEYPFKTISEFRPHGAAIPPPNAQQPYYGQSGYPPPRMAPPLAKSPYPQPGYQGMEPPNFIPPPHHAPPHGMYPPNQHQPVSLNILLIIIISFIYRECGQLRTNTLLNILK